MSMDEGSRREDARGARPRRAGARALGAMALALGLLPAWGAGQAAGAVDAVDDARSVLERWVETERVLSKERLDWTLGQEMLTSRIELVEREITSRREAIAQAQESIAEADKKRMALIDENERLAQASDALALTVAGLEERTRALLVRLPEPIRERVRPLSQGLPEDPADTTLSLSERFQNVVGILNEIDKFNRDITLTSEVRTLADGSTAEVTAVYVGLGQAYYATSTGEMAGVGTPSPDGWIWTPADEAAPRIAHAIAILKDEQVASFVHVPVRIEEGGR